MGKRVLVVEDDVDLQQVMLFLLEEAGHEVIQAHTGEEALAAAREQRFDLVNLDINLPGKDGLQVAAEMRALDGWSDVPILAVTVHDFGSTDGHVLRNFTGYIQKPIELDRFASQIEGYFLPAQRGGSADAGAVGPNAAALPEGARDRGPDAAVC